MEDCSSSSMDKNTKINQKRFMNACKNGDLNRINSILRKISLIDQKEFIHKATYPYGSPFFGAIIFKKINVLKLLIELGYDLEQEYDVSIVYPIEVNDRCAALSLACACGYKLGIKLLLASGSLVNHISASGSPLVYANCMDDLPLLDLLMQSGDLQDEIIRSPFLLQEACLSADSERVEIFMEYCKDTLNDEKRICFLGILGAQRINLKSDYSSGVKYWKAALLLLNKMSHKINTNMVFERTNFLIGMDASFKDGFVSAADEIRMKQRGEVFGNMQLCTSLHELESFEDDKKRLRLQAFYVLQAILTSTDEVTLNQVIWTAKALVFLGDVECACLLLLHMIEAFKDNIKIVSDFSTFLCCMMSDHLSRHGSDNQLDKDPSKFKNLVITAANFVVQSMVNMQEKMFPKSDDVSISRSLSCMTDSRFDSTSIHPDEIGFGIAIFEETFRAFMNLMALLTRFKTLEQNFPDQGFHEISSLNRSDINNNDDFHNREHREEPNSLNQLKMRISFFFSLCHRTTIPFSEFNLESEILKIAVQKDPLKRYGRSFLQHDLFHKTEILEFLVSCGASVNCFDYRGSTALHHSIDCSNPDIEIIKMLLHFGADIDARNREGVTCYELLSSIQYLPIHPFNYTSLKCLSALAIVKHHVKFTGELPKILENFVAFHSMPVDCQREISFYE